MNFTTIEKANYWLQKKWPTVDDARTSALHQVEAAMDCLAPVGHARQAFIAAALTAGFTAESLQD